MGVSLTPPAPRPARGVVAACCAERTVGGVAGTHPLCYFSLATVGTAYPKPPSATPKDFAVDPTAPAFDSRAKARARCRSVLEGADLATPSNAQRNGAAAAVVAQLLEPHWIGADNPDRAGGDSTVRPDAPPPAEKRRAGPGDLALGHRP